MTDDISKDESDALSREAAHDAIFGPYDPYEAEMSAALDEMAAAALDRDLAVTFFADHAAAIKREGVYSLRGLATLIRNTDAPAKNQLPWLKLAQFGDKRTDKGSFRHNDNVLSISGVEADYDGEQLSVDDALAMLGNAGIAAMVYTSPSHAEDAPRWRVLCPLSWDRGPGDRTRFLARLNGILQGALSRESFTLSQSYYYGSVKANPSHRVELVEGIFIDLRDDLDEGAIGPPRNDYKPQRPTSSGSDVPVNDARLDRYIKSVLDGLKRTAIDGHKHHRLLATAVTLGGVQKQAGFTDAQGVQWLKDCLPDTVKCWKSAQQTAEYGLAKGREKPITLENREHPHANGHAVDIDWAKLTVNGQRIYKDAPPKQETGADADAGQTQEEPNPEEDAEKLWEDWTAQGWPDPVDFLADAELTGAPELLPEHVPEAIGKFAFDVAGRLGCDAAAMALCQLVTVCSVISDDWKIQPKQHDDTYLVSARIWGLILGPPSTMKTPLIAIATAPMDKLEIAARARHAEAMLSYRIRHKKWKDDGADPASEPNKPLLDRYLVESATIEAISEILREDDKATMSAIAEAACPAR